VRLAGFQLARFKIYGQRHGTQTKTIFKTLADNLVVDYPTVIEGMNRDEFFTKIS
jgi:hypothetical protein